MVAVARWVLLGLAVADLIALKAGRVGHPPGVLAFLFAATIVALATVVALRATKKIAISNEMASAAGALSTS